ncbi:MAG: protein kinase [Myxococcales bacterium]|nr:protein kinase [Myxococcales bacterium]
MTDDGPRDKRPKGPGAPDLARWCAAAAEGLADVLVELGVMLPEPVAGPARTARLTAADHTIVIGCELPEPSGAEGAAVPVVNLALELDAEIGRVLGEKFSFALTRTRLPDAPAARDEWLEGALAELVNRVACRAVAEVDARLSVSSPVALRGPGEVLSEAPEPMATLVVSHDVGRVCIGAFAGPGREHAAAEPRSVESPVRTILVADDSPVVRMAIRMEFEGSEFEVVGEARNGREVVEQFRKLRPDVLVLDVNMPIMSGLDAVRIIRADEAQVRVVVCSAAANIAPHLGPGMVSVAKPFAPGTVLEAARSLLEQRSEHSVYPTEPPPPSSRAEQMPRTLAGYRVGPLLAEGGMGLVYLGRDPGLGREVAIKVLKSDVARNVDWVVGFLGEARAVARLNHPNVVQIYFAGSDQGRHFFVMEHLPGPNLEELVLRQGPMTPAAALEALGAAAAGLGAAHERGIFHCDVKPSNLVFGSDGAVKVTDFGIAVRAGQVGAGVVVGTPAFMAPEQVQGRAVDARTDFYSLGATLYFLVTGEPPYEGDDEVETALRHLSAPVPQSPRLPAAVNALIALLMAKSPADRPPDAAAVQEALRRCGDALRCEPDF